MADSKSETISGRLHHFFGLIGNKCYRVTATVSSDSENNLCTFLMHS
jgi:hypothetical protein